MSKQTKPAAATEQRAMDAEPRSSRLVNLAGRHYCSPDPDPAYGIPPVVDHKLPHGASDLVAILGAWPWHLAEMKNPGGRTGLGVLRSAERAWLLSAIHMGTDRKWPTYYVAIFDAPTARRLRLAPERGKPAPEEERAAAEGERERS